MKVGYCEMIADETKIDFNFDIFEENGQKMVCLAECKNMCNPISSNCLIDKIEKAYEIEDCALNLIFCSYLNEFKPSHLKRIKTGRVNIFKIEKIEGKFN
jgi:hypothetical protein